MSDRTALGFFGVWIPCALIVLSWTYPTGSIARLVLASIALVLILAGGVIQVVWHRRIKSREKQNNPSAKDK